ncbi:hypothetical protein EDB19DRAFT_532270 [Suillus lakei]|nr:hypothetical protein EDB19DRAFT_532270 [Suillus lakei]
MLQAQYTNPRFSFMESGKLVRARGEPLRALQELENSMRILGFVDNNTVDLTREVVLPQSSSEPRFEPELFRTGLMVRSQVWHGPWTELPNRFGVRSYPEPVRTRPNLFELTYNICRFVCFSRMLAPFSTSLPACPCTFVKYRYDFSVIYNY